MPLKYTSVDLEYKKREELKKEDVEYIQEWMKKQPHLPEVLELEVIFFLVSCNCSVQLAKVTIDNYYTLKGLSPHIFGRKNIALLQETVNDMFLLPLSKLTPEGYQVLYVKLLSRDLSKFVFDDCMGCVDLTMAMTMLQKGTVNGLVFVNDLEGSSLGHIAQIPIMSAKLMMTFLQEALPLQMKQLHFINAGNRLNALMAIIKPLMKPELIKMIHVHRDYTNTLLDYLPEECLPKELGGSSESIHELHEKTKALFAANSDFIDIHVRKVTDESKRLQNSSKFDQLFGIEGTFRKLDLD